MKKERTSSSFIIKNLSLTIVKIKMKKETQETAKLIARDFGMEKIVSTRYFRKAR